MQRVHRERQARDPVDAIPYHYVIGNGNGLGLGEIASDWRRDYGLWGAHVSANNTDRNLRGLGISLIGNFENTTVRHEQYRSLLDLTDRLMTAYDNSPEDVTGRGRTPGESTKSPGRNFPMKRLLRDIGG